MTEYKNFGDVKVSANGDRVRWVDFGEIRHLSPESAMWLARKMAAAAVEAEAHD